MKKQLSTTTVILLAQDAQLENDKNYMVLNKYGKEIGLNFRKIPGDSRAVAENMELEFIDITDPKPYVSIFHKDIIPVISTQEEIRIIYDRLEEEIKSLCDFSEWQKDKHFVSLHVSEIHTIIYNIQCYISISDAGEPNSCDKAFKYHIINGVLSEGDTSVDFDKLALTTEELSKYIGSQPANNLEPNEHEKI